MARKEWRRITRELDAVGLISNLDRAALAISCDAYARWVEASEKLQQSGLVLKSRTGSPVQSPYLAILNKTVEQIRAFVGEFGMTPSSRARIEAPPPAADLAQDSAGREDESSAACAADPEKLLTAGELAERLNLPESWVRNEERARRIPGLRAGRYVRFKIGDVERALAQRARPGAPNG